MMYIRVRIDIIILYYSASICHKPASMEVERTKDGRQGENQNSLPHLFAPVCQRMRALTAIEAEED